MSMIPVTIVGLQLDATATCVVVLAESTDAERVLPILIGPAEAQSIALALTGVEPPTPGTHDLLVSVLGEVGCRLEEIAITELVDGTFHAELFIESPQGLRSVPSRPSDAMALAVRTSAPIHVHEDVLAAAAIEVADRGGTELTEEEIDRVVDEFTAILATAEPDDFADRDDG